MFLKYNFHNILFLKFNFPKIPIIVWSPIFSYIYTFLKNYVIEILNIVNKKYEL